MGLNIDDPIYVLAVTRWGSHVQKMMFFEEVGEAMQAISHYERGRCDSDRVLHELADVQILINQMVLIHGSSHMFSEIYEEKVEKLRGLLE